MKKTKREIKGWKISMGGDRQWSQKEAMQAEFNEILEQYRGERKNFGRAYNGDADRQDIKDFGEKYA